ncbi:hypothetical protein ACFX13_028699 [Malus domestica]
MTAAVAQVIGGKIGIVLMVDKTVSRECIGRFLRVKIRFNAREPLMRGMVVTFPDEGRVWVEFQYEGLPNYCLYCGKLGHVSRVCTTKISDLQGETEDEGIGYSRVVDFPYGGLEARYDLRGNLLQSPSRRNKSQYAGEGVWKSKLSGRGGESNMQGRTGDMKNQDGHSEERRAVLSPARTSGVDVGDNDLSPMENLDHVIQVRELDGDVAEKMKCQRDMEEEARKDREKAFDAGLIGRGGEVAPGVANVILFELQEPVGYEVGDGGCNQRGIQVDLNVPIDVEDGPLQEEEQMVDDSSREQRQEGRGDVLVSIMGWGGTQDSDPFNLGPIIDAISREHSRKKRRNDEIEDSLGEDDGRVRRVRNKRVVMFSEAEETSREGSPWAP